MCDPDNFQMLYMCELRICSYASYCDIKFTQEITSGVELALLSQAAKMNAIFASSDRFRLSVIYYIVMQNHN